MLEPPMEGYKSLFEDASGHVMFISPAMASLFSLETVSPFLQQSGSTFFSAIAHHFTAPEELVTLYHQQSHCVNFESRLKNGALYNWSCERIYQDDHYLGRLWLVDYKTITHLESIPQQNPNPIIQIDTLGNIYYTNPAADHFLNHWKSPNKGILVPPGVLSAAQTCIETQQSMTHLIPLGESVFQFIITPVAESYRVNLYGINITERLKAEQLAIHARDLAVQSSEAKSQFFAIMSHEIRTPLNAILGMLTVLQDSALTPEQRSHIDISQQAGHRLMGLITNILDFSCIEAGQLHLESLPFHLPDLIQETLRIFQVRANEKGIPLRTIFAPHIPEWFKGDRSRLGQILFILLDNALKFTEAGEITLDFTDFTPQASGGQLHFSVKDTGCGIPLAKQHAIFEAFSQADTSTTRHFGGSGLGLSIARQLVRLFQGNIDVKSNAHQGSCFFLEVFLEQPSAAEVTAQSTEQLLYSPDDFKQKWEWQEDLTKIYHLLLVEDSLENCLVVQSYLKNLPVHLEVANNGQEALEKVKAKAPDLILMDIQMPIMDGITATQSLRNDQQHMPIIILSADSLTRTREKALQAGANTFLTKPLYRHQLLQVLDQYLHTPPDVSSMPPTAPLQTKASTTDYPAFEYVEELADLLPTFFKVRQGESQELSQAQNVKNADGIYRIGHRLKGASAVYGFPYFAEIGEQLEHAAQSENWEDITLWISHFDNYLDWTYNQLKDRLEAS